MVGIQGQVILLKHFNLYITALQPSAAGRFLFEYRVEFFGLFGQQTAAAYYGIGFLMGKI